MLTTQNSESLVIQILGSEGGRAQTCDVIRLSVKTWSGAQVDQQLLVVQFIANHLVVKLFRVAVRDSLIYSD